MSKDYARHLDEALSRITDRLPPSKSISLDQFTRQFYAKTPLKDIEGLDPEIAAEMSASAFDFLQYRDAPGPKIALSEAPFANRIGKRGRMVLQVLNDDMPFLVDSLTATLGRLGFDVYENVHPILLVKRDEKGKMIGLGSVADREEDGADFRAESLIHLHVSTLPKGVSEESLIAEITRIFTHVAQAVADWKKMDQKAGELRDLIARKAEGFPSEEVDETADFLDWLRAKNFVFLGYAEYDYSPGAVGREAKLKPESRLGILAVEKPGERSVAELSDDPRHLTRETGLIEINKTNTKAIVHRPIYMDYIAVKRFDEKGQVIGEARLIGLFTSVAYYQAAEQIPFIRQKIAGVLSRAGYDPNGHNGKALRAILEFYPRDELLQTDESDLFVTVLGILSLEARPDLGLFIRRDPFERYASCLIYLPRDKFNTFVRQEVASALADAFSGTVSSFYTQMTNSPLARLHYIIKTPDPAKEIDRKGLESRLSSIINYWVDSLRDALVERHGEQEAEAVYREYGQAFPKDYINRYPVEEGIFDIAKISEAVRTGEAGFHLYVEAREKAHPFRLKVYLGTQEAPLSDMLPLLENMGFEVIDVHPYSLSPTIAGEAREVLIRDFVVALPNLTPEALEPVRELVEEALSRVWRGDMESDGFNALTAFAGLAWRQVVMLRAYGKYLKQVGLPYSQATLSAALTAHPDLAAKLYALFAARLDPTHADEEKAKALSEEITASLGAVSNLTEDRIIRRYLATINATLRTNHFQPGEDGAPKPYLSFKLDSAAVPELPRPKPYAEIFVYSTRTEGIHLRGGKVARGGLRWSDRPEDFRTEILGLMKAQQVKNAVIVPVGSKGGFVLKQAPAASDRDAFMKEGIFCYSQFLHGLLDITDNIVEGNIVPPKDVKRLDGDDPYLVVAADKGTASFSDIANGVSAEYGFWLGDAFASGGSAGYDHKKMGITAKGAWVGVRRHFREMGIDIQATDFTCVGIGDMSGDVFGNGMLLSEHTRLLAAFNHLHIFLDPNPDAAKSFAERARLFALPRSGWNDYDASLISQGGGIFERRAKSVPLSKEVQAMLGITDASLAPDELIKLLLKAKVDLLWNGGIGTYVKSETESNEDVGDRANDTLRVNGSDLRAAVVGEGGNLGFTQRGRIEYARNGGRINTDAIDNSAGVDTSDHEVNIKIALTPVVQAGKLDIPSRNTFLEGMEAEVAELVLRDNRLQTQALSVAQLQGYDLFDAQVSLMQRLERKGLLDRTVEYLPSDKQISLQRAEKRGLTRPELAVLLAYAKIALYNELLASDIPDLPYFEGDLMKYFPSAMGERFADAILKHALKREIIATMLTNSMINRTGIAFLHGIAEDSGRDMAEIARAYVIARDAFGLRDAWYQIESLDGKIPALMQVEMFAAINGFLEHMIFWLLLHGQHPLNIESVVADFRPKIDTFREVLPAILSPSLTVRITERAKHYGEQGVPVDLSARIAGLEALSSAADVAKVALDTGRTVPPVGEAYFYLGERLGLDWLRELAAKAPSDSHWDRLAIKSLIGNLFAAQRRLALAVIEHNEREDTPHEAVERYIRDHEAGIARYERLLRDLKATETRHIPMLVVALQQLNAL